MGIVACSGMRGKGSGDGKPRKKHLIPAVGYDNIIWLTTYVKEGIDPT
jgi:hypothetical protein